MQQALGRPAFPRRRPARCGPGGAVVGRLHGRSAKGRPARKTRAGQVASSARHGATLSHEPRARATWHRRPAVSTSPACPPHGRCYRRAVPPCMRGQARPLSNPCQADKAVPLCMCAGSGRMACLLRSRAPRGPVAPPLLPFPTVTVAPSSRAACLRGPWGRAPLLGSASWHLGPHSGAGRSRRRRGRTRAAQGRWRGGGAGGARFRGNMRASRPARSISGAADRCGARCPAIRAG